MDSLSPAVAGKPAPALGSDNLELRKPHEMIVLMPRTRRVTLTGRRIYNVLLQVAQSRLKAMAVMPAADYLFEAPLPAILRTTGSSGEDRTAAKRYLREMRGLEVDWESTAPGEGLKWRSFSMLSEVALEIRHGENWVLWSYPPTVMASLKEPQRWARIDLAVLARLGTYAALALYEICARYRDNPSGVTSRKPVQWWADALSQAPAGAERREWRKFKSERVKAAIDEINHETDLEIDIIEHREGRAVEEVQFSVRRKRQSARSQAQDKAPVDANLVLRAESLGVREAKLDGLISEFGEAAVADKIQVLERRSSDIRLRGVDNAYSYLRSLLRNDSIDNPVALSLVPQPAAATAPVGAAGGGAGWVASVAGGHEEPSGTWLLGRIADIKAELSALDPLQRQTWVDAALADLGAKGLRSAVISRRAAQGDVLHGMLGSVIVKLYATAQHGPAWDQAPSAEAAKP